jgi:hypothetical protein
MTLECEHNYRPNSADASKKECEAFHLTVRHAVSCTASTAAGCGSRRDVPLEPSSFAKVERNVHHASLCHHHVEDRVAGVRVAAHDSLRHSKTVRRTP